MCNKVKSTYEIENVRLNDEGYMGTPKLIKP